MTDHLHPAAGDALCAAMLARVEEVFRRTHEAGAGEAAGAHAGRLARVELPAPGLEPLEWLRAQPDFTQYYWSERDAEYTMAGVGEADVLVPLGAIDAAGLFGHMQSRLSSRWPGLRYYGGFRFGPQPEHKGERWRAFKQYRFVVPRFEVVRRDGETVFACNVKLGPARTNAQTLDAVRAAMARLQMSPVPPAPMPRVTRRTDLPDPRGWRFLIEKALDAFAAGTLEKVVLARETTLEGDAPWDPAALLAQLVRQTQRSFEFCFHPAGDRAFIGASPERLYRRVNCWIQTEAIAGTRPRGATDEADKRLAHALLHNEKELREHQVVVRALRANLDRLCRAAQAEPAPSILGLKHCQHLYTKMEGVLHDAGPGIDAALIETLHPTPAVGGAPRDAALAWLAREEPFDRGIYAAPVGWVGYDAAEFCVGIRSGLVQGKTLTLYNGAGIVAGSLPDDEWAELENKMAHFMAVLAPHDR